MALGSQHNGVRLAAAQVIAKIATIELPKPGQWEDLMQQLLDFVVKPEASPVGIRSPKLSPFQHVVRAHAGIRCVQEWRRKRPRSIRSGIFAKRLHSWRQLV
jgi:hypothetical protein